MRKSAALMSMLVTAIILAGCEREEKFFEPERLYTLTFFDLNRTEAEGTVEVVRHGDFTTVTARLARLEPGQYYSGRIVTGTCFGLVLTNIEPIVADERGRGSATTTGVPTRWSSSAVTDAPPYAGSPFVVYSRGETEDFGVACAAFRGIPWDR